MDGCGWALSQKQFSCSVFPLPLTNSKKKKKLFTSLREIKWERQTWNVHFKKLNINTTYHTEYYQKCTYTNIKLQENKKLELSTTRTGNKNLLKRITGSDSSQVLRHKLYNKVKWSKCFATKISMWYMHNTNDLYNSLGHAWTTNKSEPVLKLLN